MGKKKPTAHDISQDALGQIRHRRSLDYFADGDARPPESQTALVPEVARRMLNELHLQQTQMEMLKEELRRSHAAMEVSQLRYLDFYNAAPVGFLTVSETSQIVEANLAMATMLGVSKADLVKQLFTHFILREDQDRFNLYIKNLFITGSSSMCELRLVNHGGEPFVAQVAAFVNGCPHVGGTGMIRAVVSDITARKQMEIKLHDSRKQLELFLNASPDMYFVKDMDLRYQFVNAANSAFFCLAEEDILGKTDSDIIGPEAGAGCRNSDLQALREGKLVVAVETVGDRIFETRKFSILSDGKTAGVGGIIRDVTERKRFDETIRASEARYHALLEQSFEALALIDIQNQEVIEVNRRFTEMTGYSLPADAPLYVNQFAVDTQINLDKIYNTTLKQKRGLPLEARVFRHKNGSIVYVERAATIISIDGRDYNLASMRDVTEERRRQAELSRDVELARRLQQGLLPEVSDSFYVGIRTLYHPSHFVSGDSFHLGWHNEGQLLRGFLVDVSGHGLATAIQTSSINVLLREAATFDMPLIEQLKHVNKRVAKYFADGAFAAIIGFELDLSLRELRYVGAGITQFYANGRKIATPGMFVGLWDNAEFMVGKVTVSEGDNFCFLTDGFSDLLGQPENADFWSRGEKDFDANVAALEQLAGSRKLRDDATGICLKIKSLL